MIMIVTFLSEICDLVFTKGFQTKQIGISISDDISETMSEATRPSTNSLEAFFPSAIKPRFISSFV